MSKPCADFEELLAAYAAGEPAPEVRAHVGECAGCRSRADRMRGLEVRLRSFPDALPRPRVRSFPLRPLAVAAAAALFATTLWWVVGHRPPEPKPVHGPNPELGAPSEDSELHVVGVYMPHPRKDPIRVEVRPVGKPMVLVLTSYMEAQWDLDVRSGALLERVILAGYFEQEIRGIPAGVPLVRRTYFPIEAPWHAEGFFYAWEEKSKEYRGMVEALWKLTGLRVSHFQGEYTGSSFVVDRVSGLARGEEIERALAKDKFYSMVPAQIPEAAPLLVVLPGGDGVAKSVVPFWKNAAQHAFGGRVHIAVVSAPKFSPEQNVTWVTRHWKDRVDDAAFTVEELLRDVVRDAKDGWRVDAARIYLHGVSSGGPAVYAMAHEKDSPFAGYWILASVFKPNQLPAPEAVKGRRFYLQHAPADPTCPFQMAKEAEAALTGAGATVTLQELPGGHGYPTGQKTSIWNYLAEPLDALRRQ